MSSLIDGFEYDIFISYRHNDNLPTQGFGRPERWVTEFMNALQEELAATIKELVSVYFDSNPHGGLLQKKYITNKFEILRNQWWGSSLVIIKSNNLFL